MFVDIFGSCMCTKSAWWPIEPKMTLFTFICRRNKHVRATSVPLPCFWSDSCNKNSYFCCCCWRNTWKKCIRHCCLWQPVAPSRATFGNGQLAPVEERSKFWLMFIVSVQLASRHRACGSKLSMIFIKMYWIWAWYIEKKYPGSTPHSVGLKMNRSTVPPTIPVGVNVEGAITCMYAFGTRLSFCEVVRVWRVHIPSITGNHLDIPMEKGNSYRYCHWRHLTDFADTRARVMLTHQAIEAAKWGDWNARQHAEYVLLIALVDA